MSDSQEPEENLSALSNSQLVAAVARLQHRVVTLENELEEHRHGVTEAGKPISGDDRLRLQRLELAVQATKDGVWDWDIVNKRIWQSAPLRHLYGYAESELEEAFDIDDESDPWCAGLHPEDRPLLARTLRAHLLDDTPYELEFRYRMPAGDYRWIGTIGQAIRDGEGTPIRMVGSNRDITDRVNATDALRASEARLEKAQRTAQVGNWEYFPATDSLVWSAETHRIFGTTPDDYRPTREGFYNFVHPDDRERIRGIHDDIVRTGKQIGYEHRIVLDDGEIRWVHQINEPIGDDKVETESRRGTVQLITERKLAEQALKHSEAQQRLLMDSMPALIAYIDADKRYRTVNRTFEEWYRLPLASVLGKTVEAVVGAEYYATIKDFTERALAGEQVSYDRTITYPGGRSRDIHAALVPDIGPEQRVRGYYALITDDTERKENEEQLRQSEARLVEAQQLGNVGSWALYFLGDDQVETRWSEQLCRIYGIEPDAAPQELSAFIELVHPDDRDGLTLAWRNAFERNELFQAEHRIICPGGKIRHVHTKARFFAFDAGGGKRCVGATSDITERKEIEEALRDREQMLSGIFESASVGIVVNDTEGRFIKSNRTYQAMLGLSGEELKRMTFWDVTHPDDHAREVVPRNKFLAGGGESYQLDKRYIHNNGSTLWVRVNSARLKNAEGKVIGDIAVVEDITRRREIEAQLLQSQKMEVVGQLTGGVAHDFNNLLTVISGNLHLLREGADGGKAGPDLIARALQAVERGADLTRRLLAFSRTQTLQPDAVDAGALVSDMIEILHRTLGANIEIVTSRPDDLWPCEADSSLLESAILNLAINARDAMADGGTLAISVENSQLDDADAAAETDAKAGEYVMLSVCDTGAGIARENLDRVFEPFFSTKEVGKGSGLGLSMVYGFARQSRGHVNIESEEGEGTKVRLFLPRAMRTDEQAAPAPPVDGIPAARGETILIVEDDPDVRTLAAALLSKLGYQIIEAPDAKAALALLRRSGSVDLLLSDIALPGELNGTDLAIEVRAAAPGIKIVLMSGLAQSDVDGEKAAEHGFHFIQKPFGKPVLANTIRKALDG